MPFFAKYRQIIAEYGKIHKNRRKNAAFGVKKQIEVANPLKSLRSNSFWLLLAVAGARRYSNFLIREMFQDFCFVPDRIPICLGFSHSGTRGIIHGDWR
jgi:hypothetical protein